MASLSFLKTEDPKLLSLTHVGIAFVLGMGAVLVGPAVSLAFGQSSQDIKTILGGVADAYKNSERYEFVMKTTMERVNAAGEKQVATRTMRIAAEYPNKIRLETSDSGTTFGTPTSAAGDTGPFVVVGDGTDVWGFFPKLNQYAKMGRHDGRTDSLGDPAALLKYVGGFLTGLTMVKEAPRSTLVREETISIGGTTMDCFVIQVAPVKPSGVADTFWVEKKRFTVRRIHSEQEPSAATGFSRFSRTIEFVVASVGGALPDDTFVFTPPSSATQVYGSMKGPSQ